MRKILTESFFRRPAPKVAQDLLGKFLVRKTGRGEMAAMIIETEAYEGANDLASHASKGRTARTEVMFGKPGRFYIYLVYGMYYMLNVVTGKEGHPSAVLIRSLEEVSGPGRLTRKFSITKALNASHARLTEKLWFEDRGMAVERSRIKRTGRIGVKYAGPIWSQKPWRFVLKNQKAA
jgi:DNA-3-methyladenine glycosylase